MLSICSEHIIDILYKHCKKLSVKKKAIYVYGTELLLSTFFASCSILLISSLFQNIAFGICFLFFFISLRIVTGGYHAQTYFRCFVLSNSVFLICFLFVYHLQSFFKTYIFFVLILLSSIVILRYGPIKNINHPLSENQYTKNKRLSLYILFFHWIVVSIHYFGFHYYPVLHSASAAITAVAIMMIITLFSKRKEVTE